MTRPLRQGTTVLPKDARGRVANRAAGAKPRSPDFPGGEEFRLIDCAPARATLPTEAGEWSGGRGNGKLWKWNRGVRTWSKRATASLTTPPVGVCPSDPKRNPLARSSETQLSRAVFGSDRVGRRGFLCLVVAPSMRMWEAEAKAEAVQATHRGEGRSANVFSMGRMSGGGHRSGKTRTHWRIAGGEGEEEVRPRRVAIRGRSAKGTPTQPNSGPQREGPSEAILQSRYVTASLSCVELACV